MRFDIVREIWKRGEGPFGFIATLDRIDDPGKFEDRGVAAREALPEDVPRQPAGKCLFFSANTFTSLSRKEEFVAKPGVLFADLDNIPPRAISKDITPTYLWETSPDNHQAVWFLSDAMDDLLAWKDLNQRLTYRLMADRAGWAATKVLRVPETLNWKRHDMTMKLYGEHRGLFVPEGKVILETGNVYDPDFFAETLPLLPQGSVSNPDSDHPPVPDNWLDMVRNRWEYLTLGLQSAVMKKRTSDRSREIWKTALMFRDASLSPETAFEFMTGVAWNKWTDQPQRLWDDILKAYAS